MSTDKARLERILSGVEYLITHWQLHDLINEYGSWATDRFGFIRYVDDEIERLEVACNSDPPTIQGREYVYRSNVLVFALMMARIWMKLYSHTYQADSLKEVEAQLERARKFV
jgi:hypothetical protein